MAMNPVPPLTPRNYAEINNNVAPTNDFYVDAGVYGLTATATAWGTLQLQRMVYDSVAATYDYINVGAALAANGFAEYHLPAGQYHLALAGSTALTARFERIGPWAGR